MNAISTPLPGVLILEPRIFEDERGFFMESFNQKRFEEITGACYTFVQDNQSCSRRLALRGLHYQLPPHPQGKLVRVARGAAFDVSVDIRRNSPTFGKWVGIELSETNRRQLWIPEGFAHGFLALEDDTQVIYKTTDYYDPGCERGILWNDPAIGITWPIRPGMESPILAPKDAHAASLQRAIEQGQIF